MRAILGLLTTTALFAADARASALRLHPTAGRSVLVRVVAGQVFYAAPGHPRARLRGPRVLPVGTRFDVRSGAVALTASDGVGGTYSGRFSAGRFAVAQTTGQGAQVEIAVLGGSGCLPAAADLPVAKRRPRHRVTTFRQLSVTADGHFQITGLNLSATASGEATYSLVDLCDGARLVATRGRVSARDRRGLFAIDAGQSFTSVCRPSRLTPKYCLDLVINPSSNATVFGLILFHGAATGWRLCYSTPTGTTVCRTAPLDPSGDPEAGDLSCSINDGPGRYRARWYVGGTSLGPAIPFVLRGQPSSVITGDPCQAGTDNLSPSG